MKRKMNFLLQNGVGCAVEEKIIFIEREGATSLWIFQLSDCRFTSGQEAKLFYAARATRGH